MWNWIKKTFNFFFSVEEIETKVQAEVKKVEEEVKTVKRRVKEKLDVNKDGRVDVEDAKEVVKRVTRKKK
jgi:hypothetical protein